MIKYDMEKKAKGRRPGAGAQTRETIAASARRIFSQSGYDRATIRAIAEDAQVDPSLVMQYFESKQQLFEQTMTLPPLALSLLFVIQNVAPAQWGMHIATALTQSGIQQEFVMQMTGVVRVAANDAQGAEMMRTLHQQYFVSELRKSAVTQPDIRATMLASLVIGLLYTGNIIGLTGYTAADEGTRRILLAHVIQSILTAPIPTQ
jgi:AcrR family transcriptional regulator